MSKGKLAFLGRYRGPAITVGLGATLIAAFAIPSYVAPPPAAKPIEADLKTQFGGTVAGVLVQPGQVVHKGDLLVRISDEDLTSRLTAAQKDLTAAQTEGKVPVVEPPMLGGIGTVRTVVREAPGPSVKLPPVTASVTVADPKVAAALNKAKAALKSKPDEIAKLSQDVTTAQSNLEETKQAVTTAQQTVASATDKQTVAQKELDRSNHLYEMGAIAHKKVDAVQAAKVAADAAVSAANDDLTAAKAKIDDLQKQVADKSAQALKAKNDLDALTAQVADLESKLNSQVVKTVPSPKPEIQVPKTKRVIFTTAAPIGSTAPLAVKLVPTNDPTKQKALDDATRRVQALTDQVQKLGMAAPFDAKIVKVLVRPGDHITPGSILIVLEPTH